ncbi:MAG: hypothetical protein Q4P34_05325 [Tissierellia bacterium]|nr:hypothetical protein [Tissierellia bacterium]
MKPIDEYFRKNSENLSFIELKEESNIKLDKDIPYPIYMDNLIDGISTGEFDEGISYDLIISGMVICLAIDPEFKYRENYLKLLEELPDLQKYLTTKGIEMMQAENRNAIYFFRFLYLQAISTSFSDYNYARLLYNSYELNQEDILKIESVNILEEIINSDPEFPLSYYQLGIINAKERYYNKALSFFKLAYSRLEDDLVKEELREYIREVEPNAKIEQGIDSMNRGDYTNSFDLFMESKLLDDSPIANYYLGLISELLGDTNAGIEYYLIAKEKGAEFKALYQDLSISFYKKGMYKEALNILQEGLDIYYEDTELLYNRMIIYFELGDIEMAKADMDILLEYGDIPEPILENIVKLREIYNIH